MPDLLIIDRQMPKRKGFDVVHEIRSAHLHPEPVIIGLQGSKTLESNPDGSTGEYDDVLVKPVTEPEVIQLLEKYVPEKTAKSMLSPYHTAPLPHSKIVISESDLARQPQDWRGSLKQAALRGAPSELYAILEKLPVQDHLLKNELTTLVESFKFDQIVEVLGP